MSARTHGSGARRAAALALTALVASSCGFGSAGIVALAGNGSSGSNAPPSLGAFEVQGLAIAAPKTAPAKIRLVLVDAESDPATVELRFALPGGAERTLTAVASNPLVLATSPDGIAHDVEWDFPAERELPDDASFVDGVRVVARVEGGGSRSVIQGVGNDAPRVDVRAPLAEVAGIAALGFTVSDTSNDLVDVRVEYAVEGDGAGWRLARPASGGVGPRTPELAFEGVRAKRGGTELTFFWDTDRDLRDLERDVRVRFTPRDAVATGAPVATAVFRVDNNQTPIVEIDGLGFGVNPDRRRGIPLRYTVVDEESDPVRVLFQWRGENDAFPDLPSDPQQIEALLRDPIAVREKRICAPFPSHARGHATRVDARGVGLPEVRGDAAHLLARGLVGARIELMRSTMLAPAAWRTSPLRAPVAVVPLDEGLSAIVLDVDGSGSRVLEIELATGSLLRTVAARIAGAPSAIALDAGERRAFVASDVGGTWLLHDVDLATGNVRRAIAEGEGIGVFPDGPIRSLVALGPNVAIATAGDGGRGGLWRLDWSEAAMPRASCVVAGLSEPWGLALDPLCEGCALVAERGADRIVTVDLDTRAIAPLPATAPSGGAAFPSVTGIALARDGERIVALCTPLAGAAKELRMLRRGVSENRVHALGAVGADARSVASGPWDLVAVAEPSRAHVWLAGGVEQVREITGYDVATAIATVARAFDPAVRAGQTWRIPRGRSFSDAVRASPQGTPGLFLWDSRDARGVERVLVRAVCFDAEQGSTARTGVSRPVDGRFAEGLELALSRAWCLALADVDADGDIDVVEGLIRGLRVHVQEGPRSFLAQAPLPAGDSPVAIVAVDLDGDGDVDLASANQQSNDVTLLRREATGSYTALDPIALGGRPTTLVAGDLDADGAIDLVSADLDTGEIRLLFQVAPWQFAPHTLQVDQSSTLVALADLDGDGRLDIVCDDHPRFGLVVFFQEAPREFVVRARLPANGWPTSIAVADFDGDGDLDVACSVFASWEGHMMVFRQTGPRIFSAGERLEGGKGLVVVGDFDGDGDIDFASRGLVRYQDAPGAFTTVPAPRLAEPVAAVDLDGDGDLDFAAADRGGQTLTLSFQGEARTFAEQTIPRTGSFARAVTAADLDADGDLDLVVANWVSNDITVLFHDAPRSFTAVPDLPAGNGVAAVAAADLDGDGDLDLACANTGSDTVTVFFQDAPRVFTAQPPIAVGREPYSVIAADIDGDGDLDLVASCNRDDTSTVLYQDAPREFTGRASLIGGGFTVTAADLDGDGHLDLVTSSLVVHYQDADGQFTTQGPLSSGGRSVAAVDLDGDGDLDLVCAQAHANRIAILEQVAPRKFDERPPLETGFGPNSVSAADLDGDGDLDLVCASNASRELDVFFQEAPGVFAPRISLPAGDDPYSAIAADLDGDGDVDLACTNLQRGTIRVYWGRE